MTKIALRGGEDFSHDAQNIKKMENDEKKSKKKKKISVIKRNLEIRNFY